MSLHAEARVDERLTSFVDVAVGRRSKSRDFASRRAARSGRQERDLIQRNLDQLHGSKKRRHGSLVAGQEKKRVENRTIITMSSSVTRKMLPSWSPSISLSNMLSLKNEHFLSVYSCSPAV